MSSQVMSRNDRIAGSVLLALSVVTMFVPYFSHADQRFSWSFVGFPWLLAAITLLAGNSAARPSRKLSRWVAAIFVVLGLAGPFVANLVGA